MAVSASTVDDPTCRVLAMSGGGSLGAIESGVVSNLVHNYNRSWDFLTGVSAGGLNAGWMRCFELFCFVLFSSWLLNLYFSDISCSGFSFLPSFLIPFFFPLFSSFP